jgi:hypothetical protein
MTWQTAVAVFSALLTPLIAIVTAYIAWQQWQANRQKLRFDQYEKRLKIYQHVVIMLGLIMREADAKLEDLIAFRANTAEADFLFGPEIPKYIEEIFSRGLKLRTLMLQYRDANQERPPGYDPVRIANETEAELAWLTVQFEPAKQKFAKYLRVSGS